MFGRRPGNAGAPSAPAAHRAAAAGSAEQSRRAGLRRILAGGRRRGRWRCPTAVKGRSAIQCPESPFRCGLGEGEWAVPPGAVEASPGGDQGRPAARLTGGPVRARFRGEGAAAREPLSGAAAPRPGEVGGGGSAPAVSEGPA